jgi:hypothetical protein
MITEYANTADGITGFFFPKRKNGASFGDDTFIDILNNFDPATATVRVGMSDCVVSRINVAQKLKELPTNGARIEVVVKNKIDIGVQNQLNSY